MSVMNNKIRKLKTKKNPNAECRMPNGRGVFFLGVLAIGICLSAWNSGAQTNSTSNTNHTNNTSSGPTYDSFQVVTRNNIFDPNRTHYVARERRPQPKPVNRFSLVGTMSYPKGKFAFFDSPNADYKKVLEPGGSIAGYTVKDVTNDKITLAMNGNDIEMKVGSQMTKSEGESNWHLSGRAEQQPENTDTNESADAATQDSSAAPTGATPEMSDRLKQLMKQREQELSK